MESIIGKTFGFWKVLKSDETKTTSNDYYICECNCKFKTQKSIHKFQLLSIDFESCEKCLGKNRKKSPREFEHLIGNKYGRWTLLEITSEVYGKSGYLCLCKCSCKNETLQKIPLSKLKGMRDRGCVKCSHLEEDGKRRRIDYLTLQTIGRLGVIEVADERNEIIYNCVCSCKTELRVSHKRLLSGSTNSCGCLKKDVGRQAYKRAIAGQKTREQRLKEFIKSEEFIQSGTRLGRLIVKEFDEESYLKSLTKQYTCECTCQDRTIKKIRHTSLKSGRSRSCGCAIKDLHKNKYFRLKLGYVDGSSRFLINKKRKSKSNTGVTGVYYIKNRGVYQSYITFKSKTHYLGQYATLEEATEARLKAETEMHRPYETWFDKTYILNINNPFNKELKESLFNMKLE